MQIVAIHSWHKDDATVAKVIADTLGILVFEARQKIAGGGPAVLSSFAGSDQAEVLAARLTREGVPALVVDTDLMRNLRRPFQVRRFTLGAETLKLQSLTGETCDIGYPSIELLLAVTASSRPTQTTTKVTERKFSLGKTLLAGGLPMTKKVTSEVTVTTEVRNEGLWLYAPGRPAAVLEKGVMSYDGLGTAMQISGDLNFGYLKKELRRLAPQAGYDERLLKPAVQVRILGPTLPPETNLDLACEILARSLRPKTAAGRDFS